MSEHSPEPVGVIALIVAAGRGERLGGSLPKQYVKLAGRPILAITAERFLDHPLIDGVRIVIGANDRELYDHAMPHHLHLLPPVFGGATRQDSVRLGLESLVGLHPTSVLIHDAARPFVDDHAINTLLNKLRTHQGVYLGSRVVDTLRKHGQDHENAKLVDREGLWRAQTPQAFDYEAILNAHRDAIDQQYTDDVSVAQNAGLKVEVIEGSQENIKITTDDDLRMAEKLLNIEPQFETSYETRTGMGYDVHRFCDGGSVWLCGVEIEHSRSLKGHSDADVALHALTDAILGAIGEGDIGDHFPPTDEKLKDAPSRLFVEHAAHLVKEAGARLTNVDMTVICEEPKVAPHREAMRRAISEMLDLSLERVSVKATTTEGLGFAGRREGVAAQAIATVTLPRKD